MTRIIGILVGLFFTVAVLWAFVTGAATVISEGQLKPATAEHEFHKHPKKLHLASDGPFGKFDKQQLQRGFQVYKEVCSACHSLRHMAFRDLGALGYNEAEIKAIAKGFQVPGVDPNTGEATTRPGLATDYFPKPYPNDIAARAANNNAVPPDLSLMTKARHDGAAWRDAEGLEVEDFGLAENLMLEGAIAASGGVLLRAEDGLGWQDLTLFEACVMAVRRKLVGEL